MSNASRRFWRDLYRWLEHQSDEDAIADPANTNYVMEWEWNVQAEARKILSGQCRLRSHELDLLKSFGFPLEVSIDDDNKDEVEDTVLNYFNDMDDDDEEAEEFNLGLRRVVRGITEHAAKSARQREWEDKQCAEYRKYIKRQNSCLTKEQMDLLGFVQFDFDSDVRDGGINRQVEVDDLSESEDESASQVFPDQISSENGIDARSNADSNGNRVFAAQVRKRKPAESNEAPIQRRPKPSIRSRSTGTTRRASMIHKNSPTIPMVATSSQILASSSRKESRRPTMPQVTGKRVPTILRRHERKDRKLAPRDKAQSEKSKLTPSNHLASTTLAQSTTIARGNPFLTDRASISETRRLGQPLSGIIDSSTVTPFHDLANRHIRLFEMSDANAYMCQGERCMVGQIGLQCVPCGSFIRFPKELTGARGETVIDVVDSMARRHLMPKNGCKYVKQEDRQHLIELAKPGSSKEKHGNTDVEAYREALVALGIYEGHSPKVGRALFQQESLNLGEMRTAPNHRRCHQTLFAASAHRLMSNPSSGRDLQQWRPSLADESDEANISPYQCFLRKQIELFEVEQEDLDRMSKSASRGASVIGQVGIRCIHCRDTFKGPRRLASVYSSALSLGNDHLALSSGQKACPAFDPEDRERLQDLKSRYSNSSYPKTIGTHYIECLVALDIEEDTRNDVSALFRRTVGRP